MKKIYSLLMCLGLLTSCKDFLEVKPDRQLAIPEDRLENLQSLLDYTTLLNQSLPSAGELASDNLHIPTANWLAMPSLTAKNSYRWDPDVFNETDRNDWSYSYSAILYANTVLSGMDKIEKTAANSMQWESIRGSALFVRAFRCYQLLQEFAKAYDVATASKDLGIVLRLNDNINEVSRRSSVESCYAQVLEDLDAAIALLPESQPYQTQPNKIAALALRARVLLAMQRYSDAQKDANAVLQFNGELIDFNELNAGAAYPVPRFNNEVLYQCNLFTWTGLIPPNGKVDSVLYQQYQPNDLRKTVFFTYKAMNDISFKGSYYGTSTLFGGIALDEVYLIRAECNARLENTTTAAMADLNTLLEKRWKAGTFVPLTASDADEALSIILAERRKELLLRGLRWTDLKRLNRDPRFAKTLIRLIDGERYELLPNDSRYVFPIPNKVIESSGMAQN